MAHVVDNNSIPLQSGTVNQAGMSEAESRLGQESCFTVRFGEVLLPFFCKDSLRETMAPGLSLNQPPQKELFLYRSGPVCYNACEAGRCADGQGWR